MMHNLRLFGVSAAFGANVSRYDTAMRATDFFLMMHMSRAVAAPTAGSPRGGIPWPFALCDRQLGQAFGFGKH
jgi:hypothetical protein